MSVSDAKFAKFTIYAIFTIGAVFFALMVYLVHRMLREKRNKSGRVEGVVLQEGISTFYNIGKMKDAPFSNGVNGQRIIKYEYIANNKHYEKWDATKSYSESMLSIGDKVIVYYDEMVPKESFLEGEENHTGAAVIFLCCSVACFVVGVVLNTLMPTVI